MRNSRISRGLAFSLLIFAFIIFGSAMAFGQGLEDKLAKDVFVPPPPPPELEIGSAAPDFTATDLNGNEVSLSALVGTPVIVDFWATWCGPCRAELPHLNEFAEAYEGQVTVIGVGSWMDEQPTEEIVKFVEENGLSFTVIHNIGSTIAVDYLVSGIPKLVVIDTEGNIAAIHVGYAEGMDLAGELAAELGLE